jgi:hypothetical protein
MGSLLSPVIANFFMEHFQDVTLSRAAYKPTCWFHYVDDRFVIWPHGPEELKNLLNHLNIQIAMEPVSKSHPGQ